MLSTIDSGGLLTPLGPSWAHKNIGMWTAAGGAGAIHETGNIALQTVPLGTITARTPATTNFCTSQTRVAVVSGAVATNCASFRGASHLPKLWRGNAARLGGFTVVFRFNVSDTTAVVGTANMFVGLIGTSMASDVAPSGLTNLIGIGVDANDTVLQLYSAGGSRRRACRSAQASLRTRSIRTCMS